MLLKLGYKKVKERAVLLLISLRDGNIFSILNFTENNITNSNTQMLLNSPFPATLKANPFKRGKC